MLSLAISFAFAQPEQETADRGQSSILELMVGDIVEASDRLWAVQNPSTDAEWQALDGAAVDLMLAFERMRQGGSGANDGIWAGEQGFQAYIDDELEAISSARAAIAERDLDRLFEANDALYTPCEGCHIDYNPRLGPG